MIYGDFTGRGHCKWWVVLGDAKMISSFQVLTCFKFMWRHLQPKFGILFFQQIGEQPHIIYIIMCIYIICTRYKLVKLSCLGYHLVMTLNFKWLSNWTFYGFARDVPWETWFVSSSLVTSLAICFTLQVYQSRHSGEHQNSWEMKVHPSLGMITSIWSMTFSYCERMCEAMVARSAFCKKNKKIRSVV